ncbi:MAG: hypothetical protein ACKVQA_16535 [Burkholderiales bacterium]
MFRKTTILPTEDAALAEKLFNDLVHEQPYCIYVALGAGPEREKVAQRADNLTGSQTDPRWVIWAMKPSLIAQAVSKLSNGQLLTGKLDTAWGFSLSFGDEVRDVVDGTEPLPSLTRILLSFAKAEAP